ncbi:MAG: RecX family transcriptional regulator [Saprospiraceae bacterium]|nr:RecX family transcriptional regulator [Saprospiraceae bacterium]
MERGKTRWTPDQALRELKRWCAVQERCHSEIRTKLIEHGVYGDDLENIIGELISDDFVNEGRFAMAYVSGKFKINEWGRIKITAGLKARQISPYNIKKAIATIEEETYLSTMQNLMQKKLPHISGSPQEKKLKIFNFLLQRGFEPALINTLMDQHKKGH